MPMWKSFRAAVVKGKKSGTFRTHSKESGEEYLLNRALASSPPCFGQPGSSCMSFMVKREFQWLHTWLLSNSCFFVVSMTTVYHSSSLWPSVHAAWREGSHRESSGPALQTRLSL